MGCLFAELKEVLNLWNTLYEMNAVFFYIKNSNSQNEFGRMIKAEIVVAELKSGERVSLLHLQHPPFYSYTTSG